MNREQQLDVSARRDRKSQSFKEQQNMAEFAEEAVTLRPGKAREMPPSLNQINKKSTE